MRNIAELPFWQDMEIAWIDVAIVFDDQIVAAVAAHRADGWAACHETRDDGIEETDGNRRDIVRIPCVEQLAEEVAPLAGLQREGQGAVVIVAFNAFDILMVFESIVFQILIDLFRVAAVRFRDKRQNIRFDMVFFQSFQAVHDIRVAAATIDVAAVFVMERGGAVQTDADKKVVVMQELGPFIR